MSNDYQRKPTQSIGTTVAVPWLVDVRCADLERVGSGDLASYLPYADLSSYRIPPNVAKLGTAEGVNMLSTLTFSRDPYLRTRLVP
jgi:hypothetical protein